MSDELLLYAAKPWEPMRLGNFPAEEKAALAKYAKREGLDLASLQEQEVWLNDEYQCGVRYLSERGRGGVLHLSIKRRDKRPAHDWRDLQSIKNEVAGWEREAIEVFPAESRLVDQADQTHLWVLPAGENVSIGFPERVVMTDAERRRDVHDKDKGSQRDWRPGISTGPNYHPGGRR